jgi:hypothetical protein
MDNKQKRIGEHWSILKESVYSRSSFTFYSSSIIAIIISLLSFSEYFNNDFSKIVSKIILSVFIILIPISLFLYIYEINKAGNLAKRNLEKELKKELTGNKKNKIDLIVIYFPWIFIILLFLSCILIIIIIWQYPPILFK